ncbi:MAG: hypothetical protein EOP82_02655 [Variovorax sp.]|nr:MAG: hypothetical protein EOP82_02655 [Variovorax sp.]
MEALLADEVAAGSSADPSGTAPADSADGKENPLWGEERIANELLLKLGVWVSPRTVRKYLPLIDLLSRLVAHFAPLGIVLNSLLPRHRLKAVLQRWVDWTCSRAKFREQIEAGKVLLHARLRAGQVNPRKDPALTPCYESTWLYNGIKL